MKKWWIIFSLLLGMWIVLLGMMLLRDEPPNGHGFAHPEYATMQQGGDPEIRHGGVLWVGWIYGGLQLAIYTMLLTTGVRNRLSATRALLGLGCVFVTVFSTILWTYAGEVETGEVGFVLGLRTSTAWMLFGMWAASLLFVATYVVKFHEWIFPAGQQQRFDEILEKYANK